MRAQFKFRWLAAATLLIAASMSGCGGHVEPADGGASSTTSSSSSTSSSTTSSTTATSTGSIAMTLSPSNNISTGNSATVAVTLTDSTGAPIPSVVVNFSTNPIYGTLTPALGTALTNASGTASITLAAANLTAAGASSITATAQVGANAYSVSRGYTVGAASVAMTAPVFGINPLSAFGSTSVSVTVTSNGSPLGNQLVMFSSPCASSGRAQLPSSSLTNASGVASVSYQDKGCAAIDAVTASAGGLAGQTADLTVQSPGVGSIQYVSATPNYITLKGSGGSGRQETSVVKFKVVDAANNPLGGRNVTFSLSTTAGGIALSSTSAVSDSVTGEVQVLVASGTVPTSVRVSASTPGAAGATLTTMSDQLTVSVGLPDQDSVSLSASILNIEGEDYDGVQTTLTIRLADVYQNPVPDGTAVNFVAEGGHVGTRDGVVTGSCQTKDSACEIVVTSQNPRPADGRVTVMAYGIGEESFIDANGNGKADTGEYVNVGEAFRDDNENGVKDAGELYFDFNQNGSYDAPAADALYNGSMCSSSCSARKTGHVWTPIVIVFSGSEANIVVTPLGSTDLGGVAGKGTSQSFSVQVSDLHGNEMPAGTTVVATSSNGIVAEGSYVVQNTNDKVAGPQFVFELKNDTSNSTNEDLTKTGRLTVTVTTPKGIVTKASPFTITN